VKEPEDLHQLADELRACYATLGDIEMLPEVENQVFIATVAQRLPSYVFDRWKKKALATKREKRRYPHFAEFVQFVTSAAEDATDPIYGGKKKEPKRTTLVATDAPFRPSKALAEKPRSSTSTSPPQPKCPKCERPHKLFFCSDFKAMPSQERRNFVKLHNLCFVCFSPNHFASRCTNDYVCKLCGGKHSSMIHMNHNAPSQLSNSRSQQDEMVDPTYRPLKVEASSAVCNAQCATVCQSEPSASSMGYWVSNAAEGEHHAAFIPVVKVNVCVNDHPDHNVVCQLSPESQSVESRKTKSAVAILDTGSDASFITLALVEELGLKGRNSRLQLGTLQGVN
jgi:hypothetical protein